MKGNRDMFYGNYQSGGFQEPNFYQMQPSGYNINTQYSAFGPGVYQANMNQMQNANNMVMNNDPYDERISRLERQIRNLDQRITKLETNGSISDNEINNSNMYMI